MTEVERDRTGSGYTATLYGHADCEFFGYAARFVIAEVECMSSTNEFAIQLISPAGRLAYFAVTGPVPSDLRKLQYANVRVKTVNERTGYAVPLKGWVKEYVDRGMLVPGHPPLPASELNSFANNHTYVPLDYLELLAYFNGCGVNRGSDEAWIEGASPDEVCTFPLSDGRTGFSIVNLGEDGNLVAIVDANDRRLYEHSPFKQTCDFYATTLRDAIARLADSDGV